MRVGILVPSIGDFGQKGYYNAQETGLAKEIDKLSDETIVYKLISGDRESSSETIMGCKHATLKLIPSKSYGTNGIVNLKLLDSQLDALIFFSDTQICVPKVYKWSQDNNVKLLPYIGVIESHSPNKFKKTVIDFLVKRNTRVYQKCHCLAKTPAVRDQLNEHNVRCVTVVPVGLDQSLLHQDFESVDRIALKEEQLYRKDDKIILFIGRLIEEKQPLKMIDLFSKIVDTDPVYRLVMIGTGPLKEQILNRIDELGIKEYVRLIDRVPNQDIWEWYCLADSFVNLNQQEIFGMSIMEAMYYGCKVVAWHAPGPDFIIQDGISGYLAGSEDILIDQIMNRDIDYHLPKKRIEDYFSWRHAAGEIYSLCANE